ncbi:50S ribosomal protein L32 [Fimbriimonas ginsengisoli]|nr:50S ribosomal protein L32 [Fimbriimonas ginsengisoli]
MPNPKRRHSHQRTALRRTNYVAIMPEIQVNKQVGGEPYNLRFVATPDGYYKGRLLPGFKAK